MIDQAIGDSTDPMSIKWAVNNPFEKKRNQVEGVPMAALKRAEQMQLNA